MTMGKDSPPKKAAKAAEAAGKRAKPKADLEEQAKGNEGPAGEDQEVGLVGADVEPIDMPNFYVVGIGASAGGLEALSQLLSHLSPNTGMAIVLVQHLAPRHDSFLAELLSGTTTLPVVQVIEGMTVEPNHVY